MDGIFDNYNKKPKVKIINGDFTDRLHGSITISLLFVILILIIFKQAMFTNIICWFQLPTNYFFPVFVNFIRGEYLNQFCWINSTYIVPDEYEYESNEYGLEDHKKEPKPYYQFIMFIIIGQILMFYIPSLVWQFLASNSKGYMKKLIQISGVPFQNSDKAAEEFLKTFKPLIKAAESSVQIKENNLASKNFEIANLKEDEIQLSQVPLLKENKSESKKIATAILPLKNLALKYIILKILNLANVVGQIFLLNEIFGGQFLDFGWRYAKKLIHAKSPLLMSREFPIFTLCDFLIHEPNRKVHHHSSQCILTINVLFEKFYVIIWFWFMILALLTFINLISWVHEIFISSKDQFLSKYLNIKLKMDDEGENLINEIDVRNFEKDYLGKDGIVMLLIIKNIIGDMAFIKILGMLHNDFKADQNKIYQ